MSLLICSYIADLIFGDPEWWFAHPVRVVGRLISFLDNRLRADAGKWVERIKGIILTLIVVGISASFTYLFIELSKKLNPFLGSLVWVYLGYSSLSIKDLQIKAKAILREIEKDSIIEARRQLSKIVGRDTQNLTKDRIAVATIESIAEGTNDGVIAPLFYLILGGPVAALAYKSVSTLDSMLGHRNKKYLHFGWFSAKLDDIINFIPARISGFLISISSWYRQVYSVYHCENCTLRLLPKAIFLLIKGKKFKEPFKMMFRDGKKHLSPNSGISEAAMAGALGIKLGGLWSYQGGLMHRAYLGEAKRALHPSFINEALNITLISSILMVSIGVIFKWLIYGMEFQNIGYH